MVTDELTELPDISEDGIPAEALENVDLSLPGEYLDEVMASELVDWTTAYYTSMAALKSARHQEDHKTAEAHSKRMAQCKSAAAWIQYQYPETKKLVPDMARAKVVNTRQNRQRAMEAR